MDTYYAVVEQIDGLIERNKELRKEVARLQCVIEGTAKVLEGLGYADSAVTLRSYL